MKKQLQQGDVRLPVRFWERIAVSPSGCWEWVATCFKTSGYGRFKLKGRDTVAHRICYEALVGPVDKSFQLDHICRNRKCVNPTHLEPVTPRENQIRGLTFTARNTSRTHCPKGHPYSGKNLVVLKTGRRRCKECARLAHRDWMEKPGHKQHHAAKEKNRRLLMKLKPIQQGDVLLSPIQALPNGAKKVAAKNGLVTLALGEHTNHHHSIPETSGVDLLESDGVRYLRNDTDYPVNLSHQEHKTVTVEPGIWQVGIVREYDYLQEMERKVVD